MGTEVAYNVQISVDAKHKLIVDHEVTNEGIDTNQLSSMAIRAKEVLESKLLKCWRTRDTTTAKRSRPAGMLELYPTFPDQTYSHAERCVSKNASAMMQKNDCYQCPADKTLTYRHTTSLGGELVRFYIGVARTCNQCALKAKCTVRPDGRQVRRWVHEKVLLDMARRVKAEPEKVRQRKCIVEHPFGTIKRSMDQGYFLTKGLAGVRTETSLTMLAYNFKRVLTEFGTQSLIEAMQI